MGDNKDESFRDALEQNGLEKIFIDLSLTFINAYVKHNKSACTSAHGVILLQLNAEKMMGDLIDAAMQYEREECVKKIRNCEFIRGR